MPIQFGIPFCFLYAFLLASARLTASCHRISSTMPINQMRIITTVAFSLILASNLVAVQDPKSERVLSGRPTTASSREFRKVLRVRVPATANPYLAGLPDGSYTTAGDKAPQQAPIRVDLSLESAAYVSFAADGNVQHHPFRPPRYDSPNGSDPVSHFAEHGISPIAAPIDSLIGVFLGDERPDLAPAPQPIKFSSGWNFISLKPQLKQIFLIGTGHVRKRLADSSKKSDVERQFLVPKGATHLYLAVMDAYEWSNNEGYFDVTITIERTDSSSSMFSTDSEASFYSVESQVSFAKWACLPSRSPCTPDRAIIEPTGAGRYHVILPARLEWGVSIPVPAGATAAVHKAEGTVCLDSFAGSGCNGPNGTGQKAGSEFLAPSQSAGELITKTVNDRIYFSVNGKVGLFQDYRGYFEFDVTIE